MAAHGACSVPSMHAAVYLRIDDICGASVHRLRYYRGSAAKAINDSPYVKDNLIRRKRIHVSAVFD